MKQNNMKAVVYTQYGSPDVLQLKEVEKPAPGPNDILIKTQAATVTTVDCTFRKGSDFSARSFTGLLKPKNTTPGSQLSGEIVAVGKDVRKFNVGDEVYASTAGFGACAEYICLPENGALSTKPASLTHNEASSVTEGALTALPFLRDKANIRSGQKVLINGASGSIGTIAVQLAKHFGADVTGVCSSANVELVKSLGADRVIDYTKEDFTQAAGTYDIIFDTVGKSSFSRSKRALTQNGVYLSTVIAPGMLLQMARTSLTGGKKAIFAATGLRKPHEQAADLVFIRELIEAGVIRPVIDKVYPLAQVADAHRYVDQGHKRGNVVLKVG